MTRPPLPTLNGKGTGPAIDRLDADAVRRVFDQKDPQTGRIPTSKLPKGWGYRTDKSVHDEKGYPVSDPNIDRSKPSVAEDPYQRPGLNGSTRDEIWANADRDDNGDVKDPLTDEVIEEGSNWQAGHEYGYEFRKHRAVAEELGIERQEFVDDYNNPEHYRPETKATNESHKGEAPDHINHWYDYYKNKRSGG
ncbi:GH-E family nuclease [Glycomyces buryatensis]|uniref:Toxin YqcG C-terminal domain-containing protein n=1 Tax=Glycomyces buryatensis TaxID=2570927 RepID=A0A4S8QEC2_9ACTN|nr:GH-E family nuclease [Glycomyces buryatensis]THV42967.1 hypothetical protein FAB82_03165 [Glycomyces buryatensis]